MKYDKLKIDLSKETTIGDDSYSVDITIGLHPTDNFTPDFSKTITVVSTNTQTGFQVDEQREEAITNYMNQINN